MFFFSLALFGVMALGFFPHRFFGSGKFHMSCWGYGFGVVGLEMAVVFYNSFEDSELTRRMVVVGLVSSLV